MVEYVVLICVVALPVSAGFLLLGRRLASWFYFQQAVLTFPFP